MAKKEYYNAITAAKRLGISKSVCYNYIHSGILHAIDINSKPNAKVHSWRLTEEDCLDFERRLSERKVGEAIPKYSYEDVQDKFDFSKIQNMLKKAETNINAVHQLEEIKIKLRKFADMAMELASMAEDLANTQ